MVSGQPIATFTALIKLLGLFAVEKTVGSRMINLPQAIISIFFLQSQVHVRHFRHLDIFVLFYLIMLVGRFVHIYPSQRATLTSGGIARIKGSNRSNAHIERIFV